MAARNLFGSGFWHGINIERKETVSAIFPDSNLTQNYVITVKQRETFARLLKPIQEQIQNHVSQDLPGYAWVKSVLDKEVEQFWINSIFTKVFSPDGQSMT